jgi:uncharacterized protein YecE (DUF72 family)
MSGFCNNVRRIAEDRDSTSSTNESFTASGWSGTFYPEGLKPADYLAHYASKFRSVEIDSTYYASPSASTVIGWRDKTRDDFIFAVKIPQSITHDKVLVDCDTSFANSARSWIFWVTSLGR